jgi:hypothetical protein
MLPEGYRIQDREQLDLVGRSAEVCRCLSEAGRSGRGSFQALRHVHLGRLVFFGSVFLTGVRSGREGVVGARQARLEITDDRAEKARREQSRSEGTGRILTDGRQLSQGGSDRRGHTAKLPADLLAHSLRSVRGGQPSRLGRIRGGPEGVCAHMRNRCGLSGRPGGSHCRGRPHLASGSRIEKPAADLSGDVKLAPGKGACPGDRITGAAIPWSFCLEQVKYPIRAVGRPPRDYPPVSFAQRLRRTHTRILLRVSALGPAMPAYHSSGTDRPSARCCGSAVVVDDLDVVAVRIEHERPVVARVARSPGPPWSS